MPESIRWLVIKGRKDEAKAMIQKAAKVNKRHIDEKMLEYDLEVVESTCVPLWALCYTPKIAVRSCIIFYNW